MNRYRRFLLAVLAFVPISGFAQSSEGPAHPRYAEAVNFASAWLDLADAGDDKHTFELLTPAFQAKITPAIWRGIVTKSNSELGKRLTRKLRRVVWYVNPPSAPLPGLYAAVEFDSVFENAGLYFQYLMLHSIDGMEFRVMRNEARYTLNSHGSGS